MIKDNGGLDKMRAILAGFASGISAASAAPSVDAFMRSQLTKGETPEGEAWKPTKEGKRPLKGAADAYSQDLSGNVILMRIGGAGRKRYVIHHYGAGDQPERRQLPKDQIPHTLGQDIRRGMVSDFKSIIRLGRRGYAEQRAKGINPRARRK